MSIKGIVKAIKRAVKLHIVNSIATLYSLVKSYLIETPKTEPSLTALHSKNQPTPIASACVTRVLSIKQQPLHYKNCTQTIYTITLGIKKHLSNSYLFYPHKIAIR